MRGGEKRMGCPEKGEQASLYKSKIVNYPDIVDTSLATMRYVDYCVNY